MKIIIANWKMNNGFDEADDWLDAFFAAYTTNYEKLRETQMVVCPPTTIIDYLDSELMNDGFAQLEEIMKAENRKAEDFSAEELSEIVLNQRPIRLGAQNCHHEISGSFTGEVSAEMLKKVGCEYVILGHSERRQFCFESDEIVAKKLAAAATQGLIPILCVGESKETRDAGKHLEFVKNQILNSLPKATNFEKLIIAYEPIWSIGSGITPRLAEITEMAQLIKNIFTQELNGIAKTQFTLYGGSVSSQNSAAILSIENVDGLLVGKASLDAKEFVAICIS